MKKIKYVVLFILLFPFSIKATTSISGAFIDGNNIVKVGKEYSQGFRIQFSDLKKNTTDTLGIWIAGFELVYDEDVFIIESIENDRIDFLIIIYRNVYQGKFSGSFRALERRF